MQQIRYELNFYNPFSSLLLDTSYTFSNFDTIEALRHYAKSEKFDPNTKIVLKKVLVSCMMNTYGPNTKKVIDELNFFISDKLQYAQDIEFLLKTKYGKNHDFYSQSKKPIIISGIENRESKGLFGDHKHIEYRELTNKDIVIDRKINQQTWPTKGKIPMALINILKETEKTY